MASEINPTETRASAFQTRLPTPNCSVLVKCEYSKSPSLGTPISKNNLGVPTTAINNSIANNHSNSNTNNNNGNASNNSPKMGSRRIFTPQFKLQVLESYRSDSDCKGNQRATARKYNIHRRQIQKWLQCESNLRSSVANINQNNVKHQFHNISHHHQPHHQPQQQQHTSAQLQSTQRLSLPIASRSDSNNNRCSHHHHHNHPQVSLDTKHQALALNSLNVSSMPTRVGPSNATSAQGVLAANIAAAVAVAIASSSSPNTSTTAVSPLRPTAIGGTAGCSVGNSSVPTISSSMLHSHHHHHHHHYPLSPYARSPVSAPVPVSLPILPHHIAPLPQSHSLHHQHHMHPYHNLSSHTHGHALPPLPHQPSAFLPTACLPVNVLSAVAAVSPPDSATTTSSTDMQEKEIKDNCTDVNVKATATLCEQTQATTTVKSIIALPETITTTTTTEPSTSVLMKTSARNYIYENEYENVYKGAIYIDVERMSNAKCKNAFQPMLYQHSDTLNMSMTSPMDLSVGSRRKDFENFDVPIEDRKSVLRKGFIDEDKTECYSQETGDSHNYITSTQVVDLTFRKRKVIAVCKASLNDTEQPQKLAKRLEANSTDSKVTVDDGTSSNVLQNQANDNDEEEEIEVEDDVDAKFLSSKPVKLFKPYLLEDTIDCNAISKIHGNNSPSQSIMNEQREPIIWSNHPAFSYDGRRASSFHSPTFDKHTFPLGSPNFLTKKISSPQSVLSPTSASSLSPTIFPLRSPKGSPVSGYESSSSTYSEREDTFNGTDNRSYSLDFEMHAVCDNKISTPYKPLHIREWLNQDANANTNTPPLARAAIALYA